MSPRWRLSHSLTSLGLGGTAVSDVSPLAALTQLTSLSLSLTAVSDVSPLAALTQLTTLSLYRTDVSDVSPLAALTQLEGAGASKLPAERRLAPNAYPSYPSERNRSHL